MWFQVLAATSVFVLILALYDTFEYAYCYDDEKRKTLRENLIHRIWRRARNGNSASAGEIFDGVTEATRLLDGDDRLASSENMTRDCDDSERLVCSEEIPLETFDGYKRLVGSEETTRLVDNSERLVNCEEFASETFYATCNTLPTTIENVTRSTDDDSDDAIIELKSLSS